jgi:ATP-dependent DNA helicase RecG
MIHALRRAGMEPPQFEDRLAAFHVTFPNASLIDDDTLRWLERLGMTDLSDTQRMALALLRHGTYLDNTRYRQTTGLDSRVATRELGDLVDRRVIEQIGTRRWATYRLASGGSRRRDRRAEIVSVLKRRGELSRTEIADALEISQAAARQWLATLRREGHVEITGPARSPAVKYRVARRVRAKKTR